LYSCGGAEESKGGDGDAAATVAHAVKEGDGVEEAEVDAAAAFLHAVVPVEALSVYCCGGERSVYCCGGAEESKGGDVVQEKDGDAAAALPHAVAPMGAPSVYSCGGADGLRLRLSRALFEHNKQIILSNGQYSPICLFSRHIISAYSKSRF